MAYSFRLTLGCLLVLQFMAFPVFAQSDEKKRNARIDLLDIPTEQLSSLRSEFIFFLRQEGFSLKVLEKAQKLEKLNLLRTLQVDTLTDKPDWNNLKQVVNFWRQILASSDKSGEQVELFILKTTHSNPFHIFNLNMQSWQAFLGLMLDWKMFSSLQGEEVRSFKSFVIKYKWLEGMQVSQNRPAEFWMEWSSILGKSNIEAEGFGLNVWQKLLQSETKHSDGIQALYIALSPALKKLLLTNQSLVSSQLINRLFNSNLMAVSMMTMEMQDVFDKYKNLALSEVEKSETILREIENMLKIYEVPLVEMSKTKKLCSRFL